MNKLRFGVVGAGRLGGFHAQKLAGMEGVDLVAVADPCAESRHRVAAQYGACGVADHRQLFDRVDAVVIAAPTRLHHQLGMEFLQRRIHVLMEKPLATSAGEADDLVAAAKRSRVVLQVGHVERFNPALAAGLPHLRNPKYIEAVRTSGFTFRSTDVGVVLDVMIHDLDLVLWLANSPVKRVDALGLSVLGGHEDVANVRLEFHSGCVATLSASRVSYEQLRRMSVWTPASQVSLDFAARQTSVIRPSEAILGRRFDVGSLSAEEVEHYRAHLLDEHFPRQVVESPAVDALTLELEDFIESIRAPRSPRVTGQHGRDAVALAEEILGRIRTHAWDNEAGGLVGPMALPVPRVVPAPHWHLATQRAQRRHREAG